MLVKKHNLLHFIALQILYLFHMDFLLKIGNKFEIFKRNYTEFFLTAHLQN